MNYPYFGNVQARIQDLQQMRDKINSQIMQEQQLMQQPAPITQNFQLAPNNNNLKFANNIDDVQKELVIADTYFLSNDLTSMWLKSVNGNIRTFVIQEIKPKDEKDLMIEDLQRQINELKGERDEHSKSDSKQHNSNTSNATTTTEPSNVSNVKSSKTK